MKESITSLLVSTMLSKNGRSAKRGPAKEEESREIILAYEVVKAIIKALGPNESELTEADLKDLPSVARLLSLLPKEQRNQVVTQTKVIGVIPEPRDDSDPKASLVPVRLKKQARTGS